jgi:hypothetical protein
MLLAFASVGVTIRLAGWSLWRARKPDLGFVSRQWVDEHRQSQTQNTNR